MRERREYAGTWTLVTATDHEGNVTERGERRAGAIGTITGRPHVGERFAFRYHDGSGTLTTSRVTEWGQIDLTPLRSRLRVNTKNSVYIFDREADAV